LHIIAGRARENGAQTPKTGLCNTVIINKTNELRLAQMARNGAQSKESREAVGAQKPGDGAQRERQESGSKKNGLLVVVQ
jgi:hypothetical protein